MKILHHEHGWSFQNIGDLFGISRWGVRNRFHVERIKKNRARYYQKKMKQIYHSDPKKFNYKNKLWRAGIRGEEHKRMVETWERERMNKLIKERDHD